MMLDTGSLSSPFMDGESVTCDRGFDAVLTSSRVCWAVRGGLISGSDKEAKERMISRKLCMAGNDDWPC